MANRRELNIGKKTLHRGTPEDIIMKSPSKIPAKGLIDLRNLQHVNITNYAYYDISKTEQQAIEYRDTIDKSFFSGIDNLEFNTFIGKGSPNSTP